MPIFEYVCDSCGNEFELLLLRTSPPPECPACHGRELTKRLSLTIVSSRATKIRNYRDADHRIQKERTERAQSPDDHDHHDH